MIERLLRALLRPPVFPRRVEPPARTAGGDRVEVMVLEALDNLHAQYGPRTVARLTDWDWLMMRAGALSATEVAMRHASAMIDTDEQT
jgi:hypothetical protein